MSKSYKKHPSITQEKDDRKELNRSIRHDKYAEFKTPGAFKRHRPHFLWKYIWTREQAIEDYYDGPIAKSRQKEFPTLEDWLNYWEKCVKRK